MTAIIHRRHVRWAGLALTLAAVLAFAGAVQGQSSIETDVLADTSPIAFDSAEDTVIEETGERDADVRVGLAGAPLRGPNTISSPGEDDGRRDYLLGLSPSAGLGIEDAVQARYEHGQVERATLSLTYEGGCNSPNGQLTVRAIQDRSWSPFEIGWDDTTRSENGTLDVSGPELATLAISPSAAQNNRDVTCNQASVSLATDPLERVLDGELGGIGLFWSGEQELNVSTLDAPEDRPRLEVNLTTDGPTVHETVVDEDYPHIVDTGERIVVSVNATDNQTLPDDAVTVNITPTDEGNHSFELDAVRNGAWFETTHTFPVDAEGRYTLTTLVRDSDGWTHQTKPNASAPHLVADGTPPEVFNASLAGQQPNSSLTLDQGDEVPLEANVSDLSCEAHTSPCGKWRLAWRGQTLANGTLTVDQRISAQVTLPRPGNTTARLVVTDVPGHTNRSTSWNLSIEDTNPPDARPLADTHLAPGQATTLENGTTVRLNAQIEDDLPVEARLLLEGTKAIERNLSTPDDQGRIKAQLTAIPEGTYQARLVLDDGTHTRPVRFGDLTIAPEGAPSVSFALPSTRVGPEQPIDVEIRDRDLDEEATSVVAEVNGLEIQPDVAVERVDGGQDLTVHLGNVSHEDAVNLTVRARDAQGLTSTASAQVTVDAEPPTLVAPAEQAWFGSGESVKFVAEDEAGGPVTVTVDAGGTRLTGSSPRSVAIERLAQPGQLTSLSLTLTDEFGNEAMRTVQVGLDEAEPEASTTFTADGLVVEARDAASGVLRVDASVSVNDGALNATQVFQESPTRFFVATGPLTRGDEVQLAAQVRDHVGHIATLGTPEDPLTLTVPDREPQVTIERASDAVGQEAVVNWTAEDPDEDPLEVTLTVEGPSGETTERTVDRIGSHTFQAEERGRHAVTVHARSAGNASSAQTFFHLAPDGRLTEAGPVPESVDPGSSLTVELSFPSEPDRVFVTAVDESGASTSARVEQQGDTARATFDELRAGSYDIEATVVHEPGAVETVHVASVQSQEPITDRLSSFVIPLLVLLAIGLIVAIAVVWYRRRQEEDEVEAERGPAT